MFFKAKLLVVCTSIDGSGTVVWLNADFVSLLLIKSISSGFLVTVGFYLFFVCVL